MITQNHIFAAIFGLSGVTALIAALWAPHQLIMAAWSFILMAVFISQIRSKDAQFGRLHRSQSTYHYPKNK